jgi:hypothetical protein
MHNEFVWLPSNHKFLKLGKGAYLSFYCGIFCNYGVKIGQLHILPQRLRPLRMLKVTRAKTLRGGNSTITTTFKSSRRPHS